MVTPSSAASPGSAFAIDPHHPGPRPLSDLLGIERLGDTAAALCSAEGRTPEGVRLAEAGVAAHLGRPTVLVDVNGGSAAPSPRESLRRQTGSTAISSSCSTSAATSLGTGAEPGLSSPLCDAVMLAAAALHA